MTVVKYLANSLRELNLWLCSVTCWLLCEPRCCACSHMTLKVGVLRGKHPNERWQRACMNSDMEAGWELRIVKVSSEKSRRTRCRALKELDRQAAWFDNEVWLLRCQHTEAVVGKGDDPCELMAFEKSEPIAELECLSISLLLADLISIRVPQGSVLEKVIWSRPVTWTLWQVNLKMAQSYVYEIWRASLTVSQTEDRLKRWESQVELRPSSCWLLNPTSLKPTPVLQFYS